MAAEQPGGPAKSPSDGELGSSMPDWRVIAAEAPLPDGSRVSGPVSSAIRAFLDLASQGPLKSSELDDAAKVLLQAWSKENLKDANAAI